MDADAILLSQETYDRLMKMLEDYEAGKIVTPGAGLKYEEQGTDICKIGVDGTEDCPAS